MAQRFMRASKGAPTLQKSAIRTLLMGGTYDSLVKPFRGKIFTKTLSAYKCCACAESIDAYAFVHKAT